MASSPREGKSRRDMALIMEVRCEFTFAVRLTRAEMRLVGLGLAGRLKDKADIAEAAKLNLLMLEQQKRFLEDERVLVEGAQAKAKESG